MKKNYTALQKKLAAYGSVAAAVMAASTVDAQVIYHDVIPDRVLTNQGDSMHVDLNNDGIVDFILSKAWSTYNGTKAGVTPLGSDAVAGSTVNFNNNHQGYSGMLLFPFDLASGAAIGQNLAWFSNNQLYHPPAYPGLFVPAMGFTYDGGAYGNWPDSIDHYLPLKVLVGANTYYGWARCNVDAEVSQLIVKSWAVQSTPSTSIEAGEGESLSAVGNVAGGHLRIFSFNKEIYIGNPSMNNSDMNIQVTNMLGEEVKTFTSDQSQVRIDASDLPEGVYMVIVKNRNQLTSEKVSIR